MRGVSITDYAVLIQYLNLRIVCTVCRLSQASGRAGAEVEAEAHVLLLPAAASQRTHALGVGQTGMWVPMMMMERVIAEDAVRVVRGPPGRPRPHSTK